MRKSEISAAIRPSWCSAPGPMQPSNDQKSRSSVIFPLYVRRMASYESDLIVIGSGPAGQKAAIAAAKLRKRVAVIDRRGMIGGVSLHTGTIPSKTFREAVLYLTGYSQRAFYGRDYTLKDHIAMSDLMFRVRAVVEREYEVVSNQLRRNRVTVIDGLARFVDPHTVEVSAVGSQNGGVLRITGENVLIACGTRPAHNAAIPLD